MTTHCAHVEFTCHFTPPPRHRTENEIHSQTMSSSQEVNYATINVSPFSLSTAPGLVSKQHVEISRNFTKLCLRSNRSSQSHCYLTSPSPSSLSPSVSPFTFQRQFSLACSNSQPHLSLQSTERDVPQINSRNPRKHTWRFRNSGNVLHCRSIRVKIPICFRTRSLLCNINNRSLRNDRL